MQLKHGIHLAYCTNIHRGETWPEVFRNLETYVLDVRRRVCADPPYAIGLRLGARAVAELSRPAEREGFRRWLEEQNCYVFTINGFPHGSFHGTRVKEQVYLPDWTSTERVDYTEALCGLLAILLPEGLEGSVSTVPGSFKSFVRSDAAVDAMVRNLWHCVDGLAELRDRTGRLIHLDLEPEPLCYLETSEETVRFFERVRAARPGHEERLGEHLRVNYDACHLAVEFEAPAAALARFRDQAVRVGKFHFSSALRVVPTADALDALTRFTDDVYLHQVVVRGEADTLERFTDLPLLLERWRAGELRDTTEWRIHYHIPLHSPPTAWFGTTQDHLLGVMDALGEQPDLCRHLEMETYTWEVLPPALKARDVVEQLAAEYEWTLARLGERGLA